MDLDRLKAIIDWMAETPLETFEMADGDFRVHLVRTASGDVIAQKAGQSATGSTIVAASSGIVHLAPAPDAAPFVEIGQHVDLDQPLCLIEAMKVFSPVLAERSGSVAAILVADGAEVSPGQPLFELE